MPFRVRSLLAFCLLTANLVSCHPCAERPPEITHRPHYREGSLLRETTPPNFTVAFIGDQGVEDDSRRVLELIRDEGAHAVLHQGDFDYRDRPDAWEDRINEVLGADFPYFSSVGNHDDCRFFGEGGYQDLIAARMVRLGIPWRGDPGFACTVSYKGLFMVFAAPDVFPWDDFDHGEYIEEQLQGDRSMWRICSWHKNMSDMQVGKQANDTGWEVYEASRRGGAIIATGHEHSYSRTHLLSRCQDPVVASTSSPLALERDDPQTDEDEGKTFVFVSGIAGQSIRAQLRDGDWWASIYTSDQGAAAGALFGVFNYEGDESLARFYFKDIEGRIIDDFMVRSAAVPSPNGDHLPRGIRTEISMRTQSSWISRGRTSLSSGIHASPSRLSLNSPPRTATVQ